MPCHHPIPAWRVNSGITFRKTEVLRDQGNALSLPCGNCLHCLAIRALHWAVRCELESVDHQQMCWTTPTYDDKYVPPTLSKDHLTGYIKRLRARIQPRKLRFFASGEYGEKTTRPHYHVILWGLDHESPEIQEAWPFGETRHTRPLHTGAIHYVAGYTSKKIGWKYGAGEERVDPQTGEVYHYQTPFIQMSRRPGVGHSAKQYSRSWENFALHNGKPIPVPRYLHESWKQSATEEQLEEHELANYRKQIQKNIQDRRPISEKLLAYEAIAKANHQLAAERRTSL